MQKDSVEVLQANSMASLTPYLESWRNLAAGRPMLTPEWLLGWWDAFAKKNEELSILLAFEDNGALIGLAPLYLQWTAGKATVRILGMADACSHHPAWPCRLGREKQIGIAVARYLLDGKINWKSIFFESVDADAETIITTVNFLTENGCLKHRREIQSSWKISLPQHWEDYLMMLSSSLRKKCRKLQRQLFDSGKVKLIQVEKLEDLERGFAVLLDLHAARWGEKGKPLGVFSDERFRTFHEGICPKLLVQGKLRLAWLECEGRPIAVEYQLIDGDTLYAYQAGADYSMAENSPGKLTMIAAIKYALSRGCETFDLLCGNDPYKSNWRATATPCYDLRIWRRRVGGYSKWFVWTWYTLMVRWLTPVLPDDLIHTVLRMHRNIKKLKL